MFSLLKIPCSRLPLGKYMSIALITGVIISFILIAFQPFGTSNFKHPYKTLILLGYGITTATTIIGYYLVRMYTVDRLHARPWNIIYEILDLFLATVLSMTACYFYAIAVFGWSFSWGRLFNFLMIISSVAAIPVVGYLVYLYKVWSGVIAVHLADQKKEAKAHNTLSMLGADGKAYASAGFDKILLLSAQDNYVLIYIDIDGTVVRHIVRSTLKAVKELLDQDSFLQVHRSHIVNRAMIADFRGNKSKSFVSILGVDKHIPVSRSAFDEVKNIG